MVRFTSLKHTGIETMLKKESEIPLLKFKLLSINVDTVSNKCFYT